MKAAQKEKKTKAGEQATAKEHLCPTGKEGGRVRTPSPTMAVGVLKRVPYAEVEPDPGQPRKMFDEVKLRELADSIASVGLQQDPIVVHNPPKCKVLEPDLTDKYWRVVGIANGEVLDQFSATHGELAARNMAAELNGKPYRIVAGERRWRAVGLLGWQELTVKVVEMSAEEIAAFQLVENMQRERLDALEEAEGILKMVDKAVAAGATKADAIAGVEKQLGIKRATVYQRLGLLKLSEVAKNAYLEGKVEVSIAELISKIPDPKLQGKALKEILNGGGYVYEREPGSDVGGESTKQAMSFRQARAHVMSKYMLHLSAAPFDTKDEKLCPAAGSCVKCPYRTGNAQELFPTIKSKDICTNPTCWEKKVETHGANLIAEAKAKGETVIEGKEAEKIFTHYGMSHDSGFVRMDDEFWMDKAEDEEIRETTYGKALGKERAKLEKVVAVNPLNGKVEELYREAQVEEKLVQMGLLEKVSPVQESPEQKAKRQLEIKINEETRERSKKAVMAAASKVSLNEKQQRALLLAVVKEDSGYDQTRVSKHVKPGPLDKFTLADLWQCLFVIVLRNDWKQEHAKALAEVLKVDLKKIGKEVREQLKAEAKKGEQAGGPRDGTQDACATKKKAKKK